MVGNWAILGVPNSTSSWKAIGLPRRYLNAPVHWSFRSLHFSSKVNRRQRLRFARLAQTIRPARHKYPAVSSFERIGSTVARANVTRAGDTSADPSFGVCWTTRLYCRARLAIRRAGSVRSTTLLLLCWLTSPAGSPLCPVQKNWRWSICAKIIRSPRPVTAYARKLVSQLVSVHFISSRRLQVYRLVTLVKRHHMALLLSPFPPKEMYCHWLTLPRSSRVWSRLHHLCRSVSPVSTLS